MPQVLAHGMQATEQSRAAEPQSLEIVRGGELFIEELPNRLDAKESHTLELCVRLTAHDAVYDENGCMRSSEQWSRLAPEHSKYHRNAQGLPLNVDHYPCCPWNKKIEYNADGTAKVVGLRDYGCSVAVDLYLRLQVEGFFLFIFLFLISVPAMSNNIHRNSYRRDCREAVKQGLEWLPECGYDGLAIRTNASHITWPEEAYPWLRTSIGACEEYSNYTDVQQPAVGQHDEPFVTIVDADFCADSAARPSPGAHRAAPTDRRLRRRRCYLTRHAWFAPLQRLCTSGCSSSSCSSSSSTS
jgi:hypothetical protein